MSKNDETSIWEDCARGVVDVIAGRYCMSVRLAKWVGGKFFSDDEILFLLGSSGSGKTEMMHLLSDSQFAPFFLGTQHHADDKTPGEQEAVVQLGCKYVVTNDGPGVENVKRNRMSQISNGLGRYLTEKIGDRSKSKLEQMHYTVPVYVVFTCDISAEKLDTVGMSAELRMFKETVLGLKYFYIEEDKSAKVKHHVANSVSEGERGKELKFALKFLMVGTHIDCVHPWLRKDYSNRFEKEVARAMEKEFRGSCFFRTITADIRSMDGRQSFMKDFDKRMEELHA